MALKPADSYKWTPFSIHFTSVVFINNILVINDLIIEMGWKRLAVIRQYRGNTTFYLFDYFPQIILDFRGGKAYHFSRKTKPDLIAVILARFCNAIPVLVIPIGLTALVVIFEQSQCGSEQGKSLFRQVDRHLVLVQFSLEKLQ